jgi:medium-chain acyl-[acyl-carrier-protein] hydrolase
LDKRGDDALTDLLRSWGSTPPELLDNSDFLDIVLPILRADLLLCDQYADKTGKIQTPLTALAGEDDTTAPVRDVDAWSKCSTQWRGLQTLPGGHLFIHTAQSAAIEAVTAEDRRATRAVVPESIAENIASPIG